MTRVATITRDTKETQISLDFNIDGEGSYTIDTGIGFFDHMLQGFTKHGFFDMKCNVNGDLDVDCHHTVEDTGIVLGTAIKQALGDKKGIKRFGYFILPMDDALVLCSIDLCGRPYIDYDVTFNTEKIGDLDTELIKEFFTAISYSAMMNIHIKMISGSNSHHIAEAVFKAFGKALDEATQADPRIKDVLSTKGYLA
ncbi:MAG: imidazoleglycerol-phosphate dehydratase HisB [Lachnospiraceae bacterium]|nr:imidazoleglycerol-phosphate dehydratase HisB [Lachnospiraceae bacterium]